MATWNDDFEKQRHIQWPAAWADEMIAQLNAQPDQATPASGQNAAAYTHIKAADLKRVADELMDATSALVRAVTDRESGEGEFRLALEDATRALRKGAAIGLQS